MSGKRTSNAKHVAVTGAEVIAAGCEEIEVSPQTPAMTQLEKKRLHRYVDALPVDEGLVIRLLYDLGCKRLLIEEVAFLLGVSESVVAVLEEMALEHLRMRYGLIEPATEEPEPACGSIAFGRR